jgi:hypothetical protein
VLTSLKRLDGVSLPFRSGEISVPRVGEVQKLDDRRALPRGPVADGQREAVGGPPIGHERQSVEPGVPAGYAYVRRVGRGEGGAATLCCDDRRDLDRVEVAGDVDAERVGRKTIVDGRAHQARDVKPCGSGGIHTTDGMDAICQSAR